MLVEQQILVEPPSTDSTYGTPSEPCAIFQDHEEVEILIEYQPYDAGDFWIYLEKYVDNGSFQGWIPFGAFHIQSTQPAGIFRVPFPWPNAEMIGLDDPAKVTMGDEPTYDKQYVSDKLPCSPIRMQTKSATGVTNTSGAYAWFYIKGLKRRVS